MVSLLWADVKYHVPTGFFRRRRAVFYVFVSVPQYFSSESIKGVLLIAPKHAEGMSLRYGEIVNFDTLSHKISLAMEAFFVDIYSML